MAQIVFKEEYDRLLNNRDWQGLVNLIDRTTFSSDENTDRANELKRRFQEQADIDAKLLENADDDTRAAYNFIAYGPSRNRGDKYSEAFSELWNSMAEEDGVIRLHTHPAGSLLTYYHTKTPGFLESFLHSNEYINNKYPKYNALDSFYKGSGYKEQDLADAGITLKADGTLEFSTDNPNKINIIKGIIGIVDDVNEIYGKTGGTPFGIGYRDKFWGQSGVSDMLDMDKLANSTTINKVEHFLGDLFTSNGTYNATYSPLRKLYNLFEDANNAYSNLMDNTEPYYQEMIVTGFMGEDDRLLQQRFARGVMDVNTYKQARADLEEQYTRVLQTGDLSQNDVYIVNEDNKGSQVLEELTDNISKAELNQIINLAIADKRLHFSSAGNGIMSGTMITIDQKRDTKGNLMDDKPYKSYTFFVKDLFKSTAENDLRKNTLMDAQLQYAKHQSYGHDYKFTDGRKITDWSPNTDSAIYTDNFGNKTVLSKGEIVDLIDEDIITRGVIDYYKKVIPKNNETRGTNEAYYKIFGSNDYDVNVLIDDINKNAFNIAANKYKSSNEDYIKYKATTFASIIMKALKLNLIEQ